MLGKDSLERSQALWCLNVANSAHNNHGWCLNNCHSLDCLLLVQLGAQTIDLAHNVGHAGLVAHEGGQVNGLGRVVFGKSLAFTTMTTRALFGQEAERAVAWVFEFTMTLVFFKKK